MKLLKDYKAPDFLIEQVDLHIELKEQDTQVCSKLVIKRNNNQIKDLYLQGENQTLVSILLNERRLDSNEYERNDKQLIIFSLPDACVVTITTIIQPQNNTALSGLYRSNEMFCTQCEAQGFRSITYYLDRPDVMAIFTTTIVADETRYPVLLSNGNKIAHGKADNNRHWVTWHDPFKKPAYLFALVAGRLNYIQDHYITQSNRHVDLFIYFEPEYDKQDCIFAIDALKKAMCWDEKTYGLEYDLDIYMIVAVNDFNMGAMENKGLNIFNAKYVLADKKTATDTDFQGVLLVIGHEYFHNWTGNRVTLRDWFQLSLKEGLTVFREQQFVAAYSSAIVSRIQDVRTLRTCQFAEDSGPLAHPVRPESYCEIDNFYTSTVYNKGSEVIRMMHTILGQEKFKKGLDLYFKRYDGHAVTTDDFVLALSEANDIDLTQFKRWYYQAGTPQVKVMSEYDESKKLFKLTCEQTCAPTSDGSSKEPMVIPIAINLMTQTGERLYLYHDKENAVLIFDAASQTFVFDQISSKPIPSLFDHFSAPVKVEYDYLDSELAILIAHDSDLFNRWDACVHLFTKLIKQKGSPDVLIQALSYLLSEVLTGGLEDKAFLAELLDFPSVAYLMEQYESTEIHKINITQLLEARSNLINEIVSKIHISLKNVYQASNQDAQDARALKNRCLQLLSQSHDVAIQAHAMSLAVKQYYDAQNMTDKIGALEIIKNYPDKQREAILLDFYTQYHSYPLVVNKWFSLQARSKLPNILENIQKLMQDPVFNILTPNHVYALIGDFASRNPDVFHEGSKSYDFLADCVIELDLKNPTVAAHLINNLMGWKRLSEPHSSFMKKALEKIKLQPKLSSNVSEIVLKVLYE